MVPAPDGRVAAEYAGRRVFTKEGDDLRDLYITEAESGAILRARLPTPGRALFSHS